MGNSSGAHLPLDALVCMSLGASKENPYNLGTHTDSCESNHQFTLVCVDLSSNGHHLVHVMQPSSIIRIKRSKIENKIIIHALTMKNRDKYKSFSREEPPYSMY